MTGMIQPKNKIDSKYDTSGDCNTIWICYRCNLTFHNGWLVSLHDEISKHYARRIDLFQAKQGGTSDAR